ncbi:hypothetical protein CCP1ISM_40002 [Azospirillaceae bacterium]
MPDWRMFWKTDSTMPSGFLDIGPLVNRDAIVTDFPFFIDVGAHFENPACPICVGSLTYDSVSRMCR